MSRAGVVCLSLVDTDELKRPLQIELWTTGHGHKAAFSRALKVANKTKLLQN